MTQPGAGMPPLMLDGGLLTELVTSPRFDDRAVVSSDTVEVQTLIEAARGGDRDAFGHLVAINERVVYRTALAATGRREDAEDVAQEALVAAWLKLRSFRGQSTFRTWLLTIVWRHGIRRRRSVRQWWCRMFGSGHALEAFVEPGPSPEDVSLHRDVARQIEDGIRALSPKLRDALVLAASGDYSYGEIGRMLGIPVGTVKWRVSEARRLVAATLGRGGGR